MAMRSASSRSKRCHAARRPSRTSKLRQLRCSGRLMVMRAMPSGRASKRTAGLVVLGVVFMAIRSGGFVSRDATLVSEILKTRGRGSWRERVRQNQVRRGGCERIKTTQKQNKYINTNEHK